MIIFYVSDKSLGSIYMPTHNAGCGGPTLNCIGRFWLESVFSASKLISKCTQMNYEINCITMHLMYCNVLQCTPNGPSTLVSARLFISTLEAFREPQFANISVTFLFTSNMHSQDRHTHFYGDFAFSDVFLASRARRLFAVVQTNISLGLSSPQPARKDTGS